MIRKKIIFWLGVCFFVFLTACEAETPNDSSSYFTNEQPPDEPEPYFSPGEADSLPSFDDYENETDYSAIVAVTEFAEYSRDTEKINITVTDPNPGKCFYVFHVPFLEAFRNNEWKRLNYRPPTLMEEGSWIFSVVPPNTEKLSGIEFTIEKEHLMDDFYAGDYRAVVFVGDRKVYASFTVV